MGVHSLDVRAPPREFRPQKQRAMTTFVIKYSIVKDFLSSLNKTQIGCEGNLDSIVRNKIKKYKSKYEHFHFK